MDKLEEWFNSGNNTSIYDLSETINGIKLKDCLINY